MGAATVDTMETVACRGGYEPSWKANVAYIGLESPAPAGD